MIIQCPNCNSLTTIQPEKFLEMNELECSSCAVKTWLKNGNDWVVNLQFVLTDSGMNQEENKPEENIPKKNVETFHQMEDVMQPFDSLHSQKVLYEEQHAIVQQE